MATTTIPREHAEAAADEQVGVWPYRWTRERYDLMVEHGILGPGDHVQLVEGEILEMAPQNPPHIVAVGLVDDTLRGVFGAGCQCHTRTQGPVALGDYSEPEPDVAVIAGSRRDYVNDHPPTALLVVEVADAALSFDRNRKASMYAKQGILDYWILNVRDLQLEVNRDPEPTQSARYGYGYQERFVVPADGEVAPLAAPDKPVRVADLLP